MSQLSQRVLVLNKNWQAISTITARGAFTLLTNSNNPKARVIAKIDSEAYSTFTWEDWSKLRPRNGDKTIRTSTRDILLPEVILLTDYGKIPQPKQNFSRKTLHIRDSHTCQYCGKKPKAEESTIDHVLPKSRGGITSWENCVISCLDCNMKKANRTPAEAGMKLLSTPKKPRYGISRCDMSRMIKTWEDFVDEAYWNVQLQP